MLTNALVYSAIRPILRDYYRWTRRQRISQKRFAVCEGWHSYPYVTLRVRRQALRLNEIGSMLRDVELLSEWLEQSEHPAPTWDVSFDVSDLRSVDPGSLLGFVWAIAGLRRAVSCVHCDGITGGSQLERRLRRYGLLGDWRRREAAGLPALDSQCKAHPLNAPSDVGVHADMPVPTMGVTQAT